MDQPRAIDPHVPTGPGYGRIKTITVARHGRLLTLDLSITARRPLVTLSVCALDAIP